jgi:hypothetical protein
MINQISTIKIETPCSTIPTTIPKQQPRKTTIMTSFLSNPATKTIVMLTDPGNEIDDEILIHLLMTQETTNTNVWIVCVPGVTSTTPMPTQEQIQEQVHARIQRVRDVFPQQFGNQQNFWTAPSVPHKMTTRQRSPSIFTIATLDQVEESIQSPHPTPLEVDYLLHVAPLWHISPAQLERIFQVKTRIFMGDLTDPDKSMNGTKGMPKDHAYLRTQFAEQERVFQNICEKSIDIPTHFARNVPTPVAFMECLPETMRAPLLTTAFNQFVGRPPPLTSSAASMTQKQIDAFLKYDEEKKTPLRLHDPLSYRSRLEDIARVVSHVTKSSYAPVPEFTSFNKDNLVSPHYAKEQWESYINEHNCNLTPFYDGIAWIVMKENKLPSQGRCQEMISSVI